MLDIIRKINNNNEMLNKITEIVKNNEICQVNVPRYEFRSKIASEFQIPVYLANELPKIVVCIPSGMSVKLLADYVKCSYPNIRTGYADLKNVSYNLSTQITYVTTQYLKYKISRFYQDNSKCLNFANLIIMINPNDCHADDIFIISSIVISVHVCFNLVIFCSANNLPYLSLLSSYILRVWILVLLTPDVESIEILLSSPVLFAVNC